MVFPHLKLVNKRIVVGVVFLAALLLLSGSNSAQKLGAVPTASLEQCRNGATAPGVPCSGSAWFNGSLAGSDAHWRENDFMPYRLLLDNLATGPDNDPSTHVYTVVIGYDVKRFGFHAIDYLGTYNSTDGATDPCAGVVGCSGWSQSTVAITADSAAVTSQTNPSLGQPVSQTLGQVFTMWGGTLRSFAYTAIDGPMSNAQVERRITLTFTAQVPNPVLSWSGHVGWVGDWGTGNSAGGTIGDPYHMRLIDLDAFGLGKDISITSDVVDSTGALIIRKEALTVDGSNTAITAFPFTASSDFTPLSFSLIDDNPSGPVNKFSRAVRPFGAANAITVTEALVSGWTLASIVCTETVNPDSTVDFNNRRVIAVVDEIEVVVCTFFNTQLGPTAAPASITGRVTLDNGVGVRGAVLSLVNVNTGQVRTTSTNSFGYYSFSGLPIEDHYVLTVTHRKMSFLNDTRSFTLFEDLAEVDFVGSP